MSRLALVILLLAALLGLVGHAPPALAGAADPSPAPPAAARPGGATAPGVPGTPAATPAEDIRDIRGPKFILPAWLIPALVAGVATLLAGGYAAWRWLRGRRRPRVLLPFEIALQRLEEIRVLLNPRNAREFSTAVSDIVRRYIEQRFDVTATHQTTEEFLRDLLETSNAPLARHRALLSEFLHQCDLVKFAGMALTLHDMESLHQSARSFVLATAKPEPAPETAAAARSAGIEERHDSLPST